MTRTGAPTPRAGSIPPKTVFAAFEVEEELTAQRPAGRTAVQRLAVCGEVAYAIALGSAAQRHEFRLPVRIGKLPLGEAQDPGELPSAVADLH
jgi:hypothetical protein